MKYVCFDCGKGFSDPGLDKELDNKIDELESYIREGAIVCVECATDVVRLSSTSYLNEPEQN